MGGGHLSAQDELTDRRAIRAQAIVIKHMRDTIAEALGRCRSSLEWSKENGMKPSRLAEDLTHKLMNELHYLDIQGAKIDAIRRLEVPKSQMNVLEYPDEK